MNVGDLVKLIGSFASDKIAMIISSSGFSPGWHTLMQGDETIQWPESQMEMVADSHMLMPDDLKGNEL